MNRETIPLLDNPLMVVVVVLGFSLNMISIFSPFTVLCSSVYFNLHNLA